MVLLNLFTKNTNMNARVHSFTNETGSANISFQGNIFDDFFLRGGQLHGEAVGLGFHLGGLVIYVDLLDGVFGKKTLLQHGSNSQGGLDNGVGLFDLGHDVVEF